MELQLELGGYYLNGLNEIIGPMEKTPDYRRDSFPFIFKGVVYNSEGRYDLNERKNPRDLMALISRETLNKFFETIKQEKIKLELGMIVELRDKRIVGPLIENKDMWSKTRPFFDEKTSWCWREDGTIDVELNKKSRYDVVRIVSRAGHHIETINPFEQAKKEFEQAEINLKKAKEKLESEKKKASKFEHGDCVLNQNGFPRLIIKKGDELVTTDEQGQEIEDSIEILKDHPGSYQKVFNVFKEMKKRQQGCN